ncbi:carbohydrate ABC transporter permease [Chitinispirillales bacterium ANBcel5]|uniref:carbohydrate ABC transporter permease n=1 Tax=Cellulosispirillum alkaliphilum TaxID=3039283 RepID=UPI002A53C6E2|nr:carbohydrate ABC transporter permease [Chitinispirillales bacterium ANBcel5]
MFFALTPFLWMIVISVTTEPDFLITGNVSYTFQNYRNVLTSPSLNFPAYLKNSLIVSSVTALIVTIITSFSAYAVTRFRFPGRVAIPVAVLALSMFPQISIVGYLFRLFSDFGLTNTYAALILPYTAWTTPIALWINMSYFFQIPTDLDKAALVDGAGRVKVLFKIILPLALPGVFSAFLLVFIMSFNEFLFALMLTIDHSAQTIPVGIALFQGIHGEIPWGNLMAASAVSSVPLVALTLLFQKYIVSGLMSGSVKA